MTELLKNVVTDTLAAGCTPTDVLLTPANPSRWPTPGNYRLVIENEIIIVSSNDTAQLHVTRGQEGTTAVSHALGTAMKLAPTAGGMNQWQTDSLATISNASAPRASVTLSYLGTPSLATVNITVLTKTGTVLVARTTTGVSQNGVESGLYEYSLAWSTVAPNLELLIRWDEGVAGVYTPGEIWWPAGAGSVWRNGTGAPSNGVGVDGDYYLDNATGNVYWRSGGAYSIVTNIIGPSGGVGPQGPSGGFPNGFLLGGL